MKHFSLALILILASVQAKATDVVVNWTTPAANTDGSTPATFEGFNVYRSPTLPIVTGKVPGPLAGSSTSPIGPTVLTFTDKSVPPGTYYYAVSAWHCESAGCTESVATVSGAVTIKATPKTPGIPGTISITVNGVQAPN